MMNEQESARFAAGTIHGIVSARAAEHPERTAVTARDGQLSYRELDARARRLAGILRALGAGPDVPVALHAERGVAMVVGALGILASGGAYLPIDHRYPQHRAGTLLRDSAARIVVASAGQAGRLIAGGLAGEVSVVELDHGGNPAASQPRPVPALPNGSGGAAAGHNLAYVIYTSGSTGAPKGVLVEHRNAVRLLEQASWLFGFDAGDVWSMFHSVSFDFSVWEMWGALAHGARLVVVDEQTAADPVQFLRLIRAEGVSVLSQTPSAFRQLMAVALRHEDWPEAGRPRLVVFGGERLEVKLLEPWLARYGDERPALVNMYGITETTVHVTHRRLRTADLAEPGISPIGVPLPELGIELIAADGRAAADGEPGEIVVSGSGVARGYLGRPELTSERFIARNGRRAYRSGDLAVRLPGGEYGYLGRLDDQMKVRGFRIEPAEVESVLAEHPGVGTAIVASQDFGDGDARLIAYLVPPAGTEAGGQFGRHSAAELAARVRERLPAHAWPSSYRVVTEIPVTSAGKTDRAALANLPFTEYTGQLGSPRDDGGLTDTEVAVLGVVTEVMRGPAVGKNDELFDRGVTSLAFMRILTSINQLFGTEVTGAELDEATIAQLASCVEEQLSARPVTQH